MYLPAPRPFRGESAFSAKIFLDQLESTFALSKKSGATERIAFGVMYLEGDAKAKWHQENKVEDIKNQSWEDFKTFVYGTLGDPFYRMLNMAIEYEHAYQKDGETVNKFQHRLMLLEFELGDFSEAQKTRQLFAKLTPKLRTAVSKFSEFPRTREKLIAVAEQLELVDLMRSKQEKADARRSRSRNRRCRKRKRSSG